MVVVGNKMIEPVPNLPNFLPRRDLGPIAALAVNHRQIASIRSPVASVTLNSRITTS
ncbi:unannotated protein [freshwater metagenome]|uniref:Unannotated protein n=1 Tax=freshwater metagenome TaxID=449393 RepID=A0A6J6GG65_9ZZZZ